MRPFLLLRAGALVAPLAAVLILTGCTGDTSAPPTPGATSPSAVTSDNGPARYSYDDLGIEAALEFDGDEGTLEVANSTGGELGAPTPYLLHAESGEVVDLGVTPAEEIPDGGSASFSVSLPAETPIGLVILRFGQDEYGAMLPEVAP